MFDNKVLFSGNFLATAFLIKQKYAVSELFAKNDLFVLRFSDKLCVSFLTDYNLYLGIKMAFLTCFVAENMFFRYFLLRDEIYTEGVLGIGFTVFNNFFFLKMGYFFDF